MSYSGSSSALLDYAPTRRPQLKSILVLVLFLLVSFAVAAFGTVTTIGSVDGWYASAAKVAWNPPNWIFGPMWTALYVMMAFAAWRLWRVRTTKPAARTLLVLWFVQLGLNCAWSFLFFGLRSPTSGLIDIVPLLGVLIWIGVRLWTVDRLVATLWIPYILWVSFATALNTSIWLRN